MAIVRSDPGQDLDRLQERPFGRFSRSFDLPGGIDAEAPSAGFGHGIPEVSKPEQRTPPRVPVGAGPPANARD